MTEISSEVRELASREYKYGFSTDLDDRRRTPRAERGRRSG